VVSCNNIWWWCLIAIFEVMVGNRYFHWRFCVISVPCVYYAFFSGIEGSTSGPLRLQPATMPTVVLYFEECTVAVSPL